MLQAELEYWREQSKGMSRIANELAAARALSAAVDAYLNAPTDRKAKEWSRFMQELAQANRRFKEAVK